MILGVELSSAWLVFGGLVLGVLVVLTMLVGLRIIKFKGRRHLKVHKALAWSVLAFAVVHSFLALTFVQAWRILS